MDNKMMRLKEELMNRFKQAPAFKGYRLLAIQLNGFTHKIFIDKKGIGDKVIKGECEALEYSLYLSKGERLAYNDEATINSLDILFNDIPHYTYKSNPKEIVYITP